MTNGERRDREARRIAEQLKAERCPPDKAIEILNEWAQKPEESEGWHFAGHLVTAFRVAGLAPGLL